MAHPSTSVRTVLTNVLRAIALLGLAYCFAQTAKAWGSMVSLCAAYGALVASLVLLYRVGVALFVDAPVAENVVATGRRRKELEREKTALLKALKELEFDHEMRKVSDADFADSAAVYRARAIRVLRQLDESKVDYLQLVEQELTKRRGMRPAPVVPPASIATRCPKCETENDADALFCKRCATPLRKESAA